MYVSTVIQLFHVDMLGTKETDIGDNISTLNLYNPFFHTITTNPQGR